MGGVEKVARKKWQGKSGKEKAARKKWDTWSGEVMGGVEKVARKKWQGKSGKEKAARKKWQGKRRDKYNKQYQSSFTIHTQKNDNNRTTI